MRIISGRLKGRAIPDKKGFDYRPTTGKLKEAIFSILESGKFGDLLSHAYVLDLFAGTASFAFESLSRGASFVTAIEKDKNLVKISKDFAEKIGESQNISFLISDAAFLPRAHYQYDLVFIDPPYFKSLAEKSLVSLHEKEWLKDSSIIIIELSKKEDVKIPKHYVILEERIYGNSKLLILSYSAQTF